MPRHVAHSISWSDANASAALMTMRFEPVGVPEMSVTRIVEFSDGDEGVDEVGDEGVDEDGDGVVGGAAWQTAVFVSVPAVHDLVPERV